MWVMNPHSFGVTVFGQTNAVLMLIGHRTWDGEVERNRSGDDGSHGFMKCVFSWQSPLSWVSGE